MSQENKNPPPSCDLCGLAVETDRYLIHTQERTLHFCCGGCQGIYRMLHQPEEITDKEREHG